jgi:hypothetical protein
VEAAPGFETGITVLQTVALTLGYAAQNMRNLLLKLPSEPNNPYESRPQEKQGPGFCFLDWVQIFWSGARELPPALPLEEDVSLLILSPLNQNHFWWR